MNRNLVALALISLLVACGSSTSPDGESAGGSSGSGGGESDAGSAGKSQGGAGGSSVGQAGEGGKIVVGGGGGVAGTGTAGAGGGVVDPRCPAREPTGACSEDVDLLCSYDFAGCLCYTQFSSPFASCTPVDPACPSVAPPPADQADAASGGTSAAIAAPTRRSCRCTNDLWSCNYGF